MICEAPCGSVSELKPQRTQQIGRLDRQANSIVTGHKLCIEGRENGTDKEMAVSDVVSVAQC